MPKTPVSPAPSSVKIIKITFSVEPNGPDLYGTKRFTMYFVGDAMDVHAMVGKAESEGALDQLISLEPAALLGARMMVPARLIVKVEQVT